MEQKELAELLMKMSQLVSNGVMNIDDVLLSLNAKSGVLDILKWKKKIDRTSEACEIIARDVMDIKEDISRLKGEEKKECKIYSINRKKI